MPQAVCSPRKAVFPSNPSTLLHQPRYVRSDQWWRKNDLEARRRCGPFCAVKTRPSLSGAGHPRCQHSGPAYPSTHGSSAGGYGKDAEWRIGEEEQGERGKAVPHRGSGCKQLPGTLVVPLLFSTVLERLNPMEHYGEDYGPQPSYTMKT